MDELIKRADALDMIDGMKPPAGNMGAEIIKAMCWAGVKSCVPAVDAAPVVRCAYCKHCFDMGSDPMEPYDGESEWYCERFDRDTSAYEIDPYRFYCADGERRDDDAADTR